MWVTEEKSFVPLTQNCHRIFAYWSSIKHCNAATKISFSLFCWNINASSLSAHQYQMYKARTCFPRRCYYRKSNFDANYWRNALIVKSTHERNMKIALQAYGKQMILFIISFILSILLFSFERLKETPNPWNKSLISAKKWISVAHLMWKWFVY